MCVVPAPLCDLKYINSPRHLLGDEHRVETPRLSRARVNVQFTSSAVRCRENYRKQEALHVVTFKKARAGERLLADNSIKYSLNNLESEISSKTE